MLRIGEVLPVKIPSRKPPKAVLLRFRHPKAAPIKIVAVNGQEWKDFDRDKDVIRLEGLEDTVTVQASSRQFRPTAGKDRIMANKQVAKRKGAA